MNAELMDGVPPGTQFTWHTSGWIQLEIFTKWFEHFVNYAKHTAEDPCSLILDEHLHRQKT